MLDHCPGRRAVSAYAGPLSRETGRICLCWTIVPGDGPYLLTLDHCLGRRAVSAYAGPLSRETGRICLRWTIVSGDGPYLLTLDHCPGRWDVSQTIGVEQPTLTRHGTFRRRH